MYMLMDTPQGGGCTEPEKGSEWLHKNEKWIDGDKSYIINMRWYSRILKRTFCIHFIGSDAALLLPCPVLKNVKETTLDGDTMDVIVTTLNWIGMLTPVDIG